MSNTVGGRIHDLNALILNMKSNVMVMERFRDDLLKGLHHLCKIEGFDITITPQFTPEQDMSITWVKRDVKVKITPQERDEITFSVKEIAKLGFRWAPGGEDTPHRVVYNFKVKP